MANGNNNNTIGVTFQFGVDANPYFDTVEKVNDSIEGVQERLTNLGKGAPIEWLIDDQSENIFTQDNFGIATAGAQRFTEALSKAKGAAASLETMMSSLGADASKGMVQAISNMTNMLNSEVKGLEHSIKHFESLSKETSGFSSTHYSDLSDAVGMRRNTPYLSAFNDVTHGSSNVLDAANNIQFIANYGQRKGNRISLDKILQNREKLNYAYGALQKRASMYGNGSLTIGELTHSLLLGDDRTKQGSYIASMEKALGVKNITEKEASGVMQVLAAASGHSYLGHGMSKESARYLNTFKIGSEADKIPAFLLESFKHGGATQQRQIVNQTNNKGQSKDFILNSVWNNLLNMAQGDRRGYLREAIFDAGLGRRVRGNDYFERNITRDQAGKLAGIVARNMKRSQVSTPLFERDPFVVGEGEAAQEKRWNLQFEAMLQAANELDKIGLKDSEIGITEAELKEIKQNKVLSANKQKEFLAEVESGRYVRRGSSSAKYPTGTVIPNLRMGTDGRLEAYDYDWKKKGVGNDVARDKWITQSSSAGVDTLARTVNSAIYQGRAKGYEPGVGYGFGAKADSLFANKYREEGQEEKAPLFISVNRSTDGKNGIKGLRAYDPTKPFGTDLDMKEANRYSSVINNGDMGQGGSIMDANGNEYVFGYQNVENDQLMLVEKKAAEAENKRLKALGLTPMQAYGNITGLRVFDKNGNVVKDKSVKQVNGAKSRYTPGVSLKEEYGTGFDINPILSGAETAMEIMYGKDAMKDVFADSAAYIMPQLDIDGKRVESGFKSGHQIRDVGGTVKTFLQEANWIDTFRSLATKNNPFFDFDNDGKVTHAYVPMGGRDDELRMMFAELGLGEGKGFEELKQEENESDSDFQKRQADVLNQRKEIVNKYKERGMFYDVLAKDEKTGAYKYNTMYNTSNVKNTDKFAVMDLEQYLIARMNDKNGVTAENLNGTEHSSDDIMKYWTGLEDSEKAKILSRATGRKNLMGRSAAGLEAAALSSYDTMTDEQKQMLKNVSGIENAEDLAKFQLSIFTTAEEQNKYMRMGSAATGGAYSVHSANELMTEQDIIAPSMAEALFIPKEARQASNIEAIRRIEQLKTNAGREEFLKNNPRAKAMMDQDPNWSKSDEANSLVTNQIQRIEQMMQTNAIFLKKGQGEKLAGLTVAKSRAEDEARAAGALTGMTQGQTIEAMKHSDNKYRVALAELMEEAESGDNEFLRDLVIDSEDITNDRGEFLLSRFPAAMGQMKVVKNALNIQRFSRMNPDKLKNVDPMFLDKDGKLDTKKVETAKKVLDTYAGLGYIQREQVKNQKGKDIFDSKGNAVYDYSMNDGTFLTAAQMYNLNTADFDGDTVARFALDHRTLFAQAKTIDDVQAYLKQNEGKIKKELISEDAAKDNVAKDVSLNDVVSKAAENNYLSQNAMGFGSAILREAAALPDDDPRKIRMLAYGTKYYDYATSEVKKQGIRLNRTKDMAAFAGGGELYSRFQKDLINMENNPDEADPYRIFRANMVKRDDYTGLNAIHARSQMADAGFFNSQSTNNALASYLTENFDPDTYMGQAARMYAQMWGNQMTGKRLASRKDIAEYVNLIGTWGADLDKRINEGGLTTDLIREQNAYRDAQHQATRLTGRNGQLPELATQASLAADIQKATDDYNAYSKKLSDDYGINIDDAIANATITKDGAILETTDVYSEIENSLLEQIEAYKYTSGKTNMDMSHAIAPLEERLGKVQKNKDVVNNLIKNALTSGSLRDFLTDTQNGFKSGESDTDLTLLSSDEKMRERAEATRATRERLLRMKVSDDDVNEITKLIRTKRNAVGKSMHSPISATSALPYMEYGAANDLALSMEAMDMMLDKPLDSENISKGTYVLNDGTLSEKDRIRRARQRSDSQAKAILGINANTGSSVLGTLMHNAAELYLTGGDDNTYSAYGVDDKGNRYKKTFKQIVSELALGTNGGERVMTSGNEGNDMSISDALKEQGIFYDESKRQFDFNNHRTGFGKTGSLEASKDLLGQELFPTTNLDKYNALFNSDRMEKILGFFNATDQTIVAFEDKVRDANGEYKKVGDNYTVSADKLTSKRGTHVTDDIKTRPLIDVMTKDNKTGDYWITDFKSSDTAAKQSFMQQAIYKYMLQNMSADEIKAQYGDEFSVDKIAGFQGIDLLGGKAYRVRDTAFKKDGKEIAYTIDGSSNIVETDDITQGASTLSQLAGLSYAHSIGKISDVFTNGKFSDEALRKIIANISKDEDFMEHMDPRLKEQFEAKRVQLEEQNKEEREKEQIEQRVTSFRKRKEGTGGDFVYNGDNWLNSTSADLIKEQESEVEQMRKLMPRNYDSLKYTEFNGAAGRAEGFLTSFETNRDKLAQIRAEADQRKDFITTSRIDEIINQENALRDEISDGSFFSSEAGKAQRILNNQQEATTTKSFGDVQKYLSAYNSAKSAAELVNKREAPEVSGDGNMTKPGAEGRQNVLNDLLITLDDRLNEVIKGYVSDAEKQIDSMLGKSQKKSSGDIIKESLNNFDKGMDELVASRMTDKEKYLEAITNVQNNNKLKADEKEIFIGTDGKGGVYGRLIEEADKVINLYGANGQGRADARTEFENKATFLSKYTEDRDRYKNATSISSFLTNSGDADLGVLGSTIGLHNKYASQRLSLAEFADYASKIKDDNDSEKKLAKKIGILNDDGTINDDQISNISKKYIKNDLLKSKGDLFMAAGQRQKGLRMKRSTKLTKDASEIFAELQEMNKTDGNDADLKTIKDLIGIDFNSKDVDNVYKIVQFLSDKVEKSDSYTTNKEELNKLNLKKSSGSFTASDVQKYDEKYYENRLEDLKKDYGMTDEEALNQVIQEQEEQKRARALNAASITSATGKSSDIQNYNTLLKQDQELQRSRKLEEDLAYKYIKKDENGNILKDEKGEAIIDTKGLTDEIAQINKDITSFENQKRDLSVIGSDISAGNVKDLNNKIVDVFGRPTDKTVLQKYEEDRKAVKQAQLEQQGYTTDQASRMAQNELDKEKKSRDMTVAQARAKSMDVKDAIAASAYVNEHKYDQLRTQMALSGMSNDAIASSIGAIQAREQSSTIASVAGTVYGEGSFAAQQAQLDEKNQQTKEKLINASNNYLLNRSHMSAAQKKNTEDLFASYGVKIQDKAAALDQFAELHPEHFATDTFGHRQQADMNDVISNFEKGKYVEKTYSSDDVKKAYDETIEKNEELKKQGIVYDQEKIDSIMSNIDLDPSLNNHEKDNKGTGLYALKTNGERGKEYTYKDLSIMKKEGTLYDRSFYRGDEGLSNVVNLDGREISIDDPDLKNSIDNGKAYSVYADRYTTTETERKLDKKAAAEKLKAGAKLSYTVKDKHGNETVRTIDEYDKSRLNMAFKNNAKNGKINFTVSETEDTLKGKDFSYLTEDELKKRSTEEALALQDQRAQAMLDAKQTATSMNAYAQDMTQGYNMQSVGKKTSISHMERNRRNQFIAQNYGNVPFIREITSGISEKEKYLSQANQYNASAVRERANMQNIIGSDSTALRYTQGSFSDTEKEELKNYEDLRKRVANGEKLEGAELSNYNSYKTKYDATVRYKESEQRAQGYQDEANNFSKQGNGWHTAANIGGNIGSKVINLGSGLVKRFGRQYFQKAISEVKQFVQQYDAAMTEIEMINTGNGKSMTDQKRQSISSNIMGQAKALKASAVDVAKVQSSLYRQGLDESEVNSRTEDVIKFSKVTGTDVTKATKYLTTAVNSGLVDSINEAADAMAALGDTAATTAEEIAKAMQKSASSASLVGVSFESLTAMITAATSGTQLGGTQVGTALNTVFSRLNGISKSDYFKDASGETVNKNNVQAVLRSIGYNGEVVGNAEEVFDFIASNWSILNDTQKSALTNALGGTRQQNILSSVFDAYSETSEEDSSKTVYQQYKDTIADSSGTVDSKYSVYEESYSANIDALKTSIDSLADSGAFNKIISGITGMINALSDTQTVQEMGTTITAVAFSIMGLATALMAVKGGLTGGVAGAVAGAVSGLALMASLGVGLAVVSSYSGTKTQEEKDASVSEFREKQMTKISNFKDALAESAELDDADVDVTIEVNKDNLNDVIDELDELDGKTVKIKVENEEDQNSVELALYEKYFNTALDQFVADSSSRVREYAYTDREYSDFTKSGSNELTTYSLDNNGGIKGSSLSGLSTNTFKRLHKGSASLNSVDEQILEDLYYEYISDTDEGKERLAALGAGTFSEFISGWENNAASQDFLAWLNKTDENGLSTFAKAKNQTREEIALYEPDTVNEMLSKGNYANKNGKYVSIDNLANTDISTIDEEYKSIMDEAYLDFIKYGEGLTEDQKEVLANTSSFEDIRTVFSGEENEVEMNEIFNKFTDYIKEYANRNIKTNNEALETFYEEKAEEAASDFAEQIYGFLGIDKSVVMSVIQAKYQEWVDENKKTNPDFNGTVEDYLQTDGVTNELANLFYSGEYTNIASKDSYQWMLGDTPILSTDSDNEILAKFAEGKIEKTVAKSDSGIYDYSAAYGFSYDQNTGAVTITDQTKAGKLLGKVTSTNGSGTTLKQDVFDTAKAGLLTLSSSDTNYAYDRTKAQKLLRTTTTMDEFRDTMNNEEYSGVSTLITNNPVLEALFAKAGTTGDAEDWQAARSALEYYANTGDISSTNSSFINRIMSDAEAYKAEYGTLEGFTEKMDTYDLAALNALDTDGELFASLSSGDFEGATDAAANLNEQFNEEAITNLRLYGKASEGVAEADKRFSHDADEAAESITSLNSKLNDYRKKLGTLQRFMNGEASSSDKDTIASMLGLGDADDVDWDSDEIKEKVKQYMELIQQALNDSLQETVISDAKNGITSYLKSIGEEFDNNMVVLDNSVTLDTEGAIKVEKGMDIEGAMRAAGVAEDAKAEVRAAIESILLSLQEGESVAIKVNGDTVGEITLSVGETTGAGGGKSSGGGGGKSKSQKLLDKQKHETTQYEHLITMNEKAQTFYQESGELTNYGKELEEELALRKQGSEMYEEQIASLIEQQSKVKKGSDDWYSLKEAINEAEEALEDNNTEMLKTVKEIEENRQAILKLRSDLEDTVAEEIKARIETAESMVESTSSMSDTILEIIKNRYQDEWDLIKEDIDKKKEALEEEKELINERLQARKDAEDDAAKYTELQELQTQLSLISLDSTRTKDAAELRKKISDLQSEIGWSLTEDLTNSEIEDIEDQIEAYDDYIETGDEKLEDFLEDANNFTEAVEAVLYSSKEDLIQWLKDNDEEYKNSLAVTQQTMVYGWEDTFQQMYNIVDTYFTMINDILSSKEKYLEYMKQSDDYLNASEASQAQMLYEWGEAYDDYVSSILDSDTIKTHQDDSLDSVYKGSKSNSTSIEEVNEQAETITTTAKEYANSMMDEVLAGFEETRDLYEENSTDYTMWQNVIDTLIAAKDKFNQYKDGGFVDYTGLAWVDGTPSKPEAFLNSYDTELLSNLVKALSYVNVPSMESYDYNNGYGNVENTIGEVNVTINGAEFNKDSDYDDIARRVGEQFAIELTKQGFSTANYNF